MKQTITGIISGILFTIMIFTVMGAAQTTSVVFFSL